MSRQDSDGRKDSNHRDIQGLLPWDVNGTLAGQELEGVEDHLAACTLCQEETTRCRHLSAAVQAAEGEGCSPFPEHFSRLMARIEVAEALSKPHGNWCARLPAWVTGYSSLLQATPRAVRLSLLSACALNLFLAVLVVIVWQQSPAPESLYHALSNAPEQTPQAPAQIIRVVFAEDATEKEIRELLTSLTGTIIKGPSTWGAYSVDVSSEGSPPDHLRIVRDTLRAHPKVRLAELTTTR